MSGADIFSLIVVLLGAGLRTGTPLLFAAVGGVVAERVGVMNLGIEGMMLVGAVSGFITAHLSGSPWLGLVVGILAGGLLSLLHGLVVISLRGDQVVSGLALVFIGRGLSSVMGTPYVRVREIPTLPDVSLSFLERIPWLGPNVLSPLFGNQNVVFYLGLLVVLLVWFLLERTRWGLNLRAVGEYPAAADSLGINVVRTRYLYLFLGGMLCGMAGASLSLAITPLWVDDMTAGQGWIAIVLVIFSGWNPWRAAGGAYIFGALRRLPLDLQAIPQLPFMRNPVLGVWLTMIPYAFTIIVLLLASGETLRRRWGAPAALGTPYVRGERGV